MGKASVLFLNKYTELKQWFAELQERARSV